MTDIRLKCDCGEGVKNQATHIAKPYLAIVLWFFPGGDLIFTAYPM